MISQMTNLNNEKNSILARNLRQSMTWIFFQITVAGNALSITCSDLPLLFCPDPVLSPGSTKIIKSQYLSSPPPSPVVETDTYGDSSALWAPTQTVQHCPSAGVREDITKEGSLDLSLRRRVGVWQGWRISHTEQRRTGKELLHCNKYPDTWWAEVSTLSWPWWTLWKPPLQN